MLVKWFELALYAEKIPVENYSSYYLHKMLEDAEKMGLKDLPADLVACHTDVDLLNACFFLCKHLSVTLLRRYRSQLDSQHERELMEDWKGAFDEN